jgi:hypothetical protein
MRKQLFLTLFLLTVFAAAGLAQSKPDQTIDNARDEFFDIKNRSITMERMKRDSRKRPVSRDYTPQFPEIKEDFEQIQKLNAGVYQLAAARAPLNYAAVLKSVSEIKRRSARLKSNLFADAEDEEKEPADKGPVVPSEDFKTLLGLLDTSLNKFVHSSMFQKLSLVNSADSLAARKDLETVIKVAAAIKEKAKKLAKTDSPK